MLRLRLGNDGSLSRTRSCLWNVDGLYCGLWILLQQLIVASSTIFVVLVAKDLASNSELPLIYLFSFFGALVTAYIPGVLSQIYLQRYLVSSFRRYIDEFVDHYSMQRTLAHQRFKDQYESWITSESKKVFEECTGLAFRLLSTFLNAVINIVVIGVLLDPTIICGYIVAFIALYGTQRHFRVRIDDSSTSLQLARQRLSQTLLRAWDNVMIGNIHNLARWRHYLSSALIQFQDRAISYSLVQSFVSGFAVISALVAVGGSVALHVHNSMADVGALAALVVTFPRQVQILQSLFSFFTELLAWEGMNARLKGLSAALQIRKPNPSLHIQWEKLEFFDNETKQIWTSVSGLREYLDRTPQGRLRVGGPNGSGKTTLLTALGTELRDRAFYLPTHSDLLFDCIGSSDLSDGQRIIACLDELATTGLPSILLLDEWDANLDKNNRTLLDQKIDAFAQEGRVVEVRHLVQ